ncbi:MAG: AEC family transporter [Firmicutes bacterium]|nr:AEC family transporter [Bacillota bacterium]
MTAVIQSFYAIFPILAYMGLGFFLKKKGYMKGNSASEMNRLVFNIFLPLSIFQNIYTTDLRSNFDVKIAAFVTVTSIAAFIILGAIVPRYEHNETVIPVVIQAIHKANYNLLAIPIVSSFITGDLGMTAVLMAVITPIVNTCSSLVFEKYTGKSTSRKQKLMKILKNPLVLSSLLGMAFNLLSIPLPKFIMSGVVKSLSSMATPIALLALGSTFDFSSLGKFKRQLAAISLGKLIVMPAVIVTLAIICGIRGADLLAIVVFSGSPAAVNTYSTAVSMGGNEELAGQAVVLTSSLSVITLFMILSAIGLMGMY